MKKIQKIIELTNGEPTPFDVLSYEREWTQEELNALSTLEAFKNVKELALQFNRTEAAVIAKYFEIRNGLDEQILLDVMFAPDDKDWVEFSEESYEMDDLIQNVTYINAKVGDIVKVNVRTLIPFSPQTPFKGFYEVPTESAPINNSISNAHNTDADRWASITAQITNTGVFALGTEITGIRRSVLFIVEE
jgi:hypothetical protein